MPRLLTFTLLAVLLLLTPPADAQRTADWQISLYTLGPIRVGMTKAEVQRAAGVQFYEQEMGDCAYGDANASVPGLEVFRDHRDGSVSHFVIRSPARFRTLSGIGIGSTEREVRRAYGDRIRSVPHPSQFMSDGTPVLSYQPRDRADRNAALMFEIDHTGRVSQIMWGTRTTVEQETCGFG